MSNVPKSPAAANVNQTPDAGQRNPEETHADGAREAQPPRNRPRETHDARRGGPDAAPTASQPSQPSQRRLPEKPPQPDSRPGGEARRAPKNIQAKPVGDARAQRSPRETGQPSGQAPRDAALAREPREKRPPRAPRVVEPNPIPPITFPEALPVSARRDEIARAIERNQVVDRKSVV